MATYTKIDRSEIIEILKSYRIHPVDIKPIEGGNSNTNYHIESDQGVYVLTIAEENPIDKVQCLVSLLKQFEHSGFLSSVILETVSGKTITQYSGKPVFLKKWISGAVFEDLSEKMLFEAGQAMAKLHQIKSAGCLPKKHSYGVELFSTIMDNNIDPEYESWVKARAKFLIENIPVEAPQGLIHGDLFFDNVLFEKGKFKAIIDFEEACYYYLAFDVGMGILGLCKTKDLIDLQKAKVFVQGYESIRELEIVEKENLKLFTAYAAIATSYWRYWRYNIYTPIPESSAKHRDMMKIAKQVEALSQKEFHQ